MTEQWREEREHLEEILSRDEYLQYLEGRGDGGNWFMALTRRFLDWLANLFPDVQMPDGASSFLAYALIGLLIVAVLGLIAWSLRGIVLNRRADRRTGLIDKAAMKQSSEALWRQAEQLAAEARYAEAIRLLYMSMLLLMDERKWVRAAEWKANFEYKLELADTRPDEGERFETAARLFERVYFGRGRADARVYEQMKSYVAHWRESGGQDDAKS